MSLGLLTRASSGWRRVIQIADQGVVWVAPCHSDCRPARRLGGAVSFRLLTRARVVEVLRVVAVLVRALRVVAALVRVVTVLVQEEKSYRCSATAVSSSFGGQRRSMRSRRAKSFCFCLPSDEWGIPTHDVTAIHAAGTRSLPKR